MPAGLWEYTNETTNESEGEVSAVDANQRGDLASARSTIKTCKKKKKKKDMMRSSTFKREKIALRLGGAVIKRMQYVQGRICGEHA